ncbi:MAG: RIP metalloprotease RseP [Patescibacteria group bacterium]|jgi:regulator of sigma E protease
MFLTLIVFILVLSLLIFVHEFGHFWTARKLGVKVEEFGFGFSPRVIGVYKSNEGKWKVVHGNKEVTDAVDTIYSLNWLPLGGFCKIKGEDGSGESESDSFGSKPVWRRMAIISAGVIMNVLLAAVFFSIGFMIGSPQGFDSNDKHAIVSERKIQILEVAQETPAATAELTAGDFILAVDGQSLVDEKDLRAYVNPRAGEELIYKIERDGNILEKKVIPADHAGKGEIGVSIANIGLVRYPWYLAILKGFMAAGIMVWIIILAFLGIIKNLIMGNGIGADIAGPVGIANMTGQYARMGISYLIQFTGLLSVNLAVINFLPLPALDGGRIIFLIIEKVKGSPVRREVEGAIHSVGFFVLIALMVLVIVRDVLSLF